MGTTEYFDKIQAIKHYNHYFINGIIIIIVIIIIDNVIIIINGVLNIL